MPDLARYRNDGIVFPAGHLELDDPVGRYRTYQTASQRLRGKDTYLKAHLVSRWVSDLARHPVLVAAVEPLVGSDIVLWSCDWNVKRAGTGDYVPWHQDAPYWNLSSDDVVTVWIAVGDVTRHNGAMQVVPGSHREGRLGEIDAASGVFEAYSEGQRTTDDDCMFPFAHLKDDYDDRSVFVELRSGEFSMHSINLIHGGGPNPSTADRIGLGLRYMSADTRFIGEIDSVTAIKGDCLRDHFVLEPEPDGEWTVAGVAALETALHYPSGFGEAKRKR
ncbi:MAG: phytanoyl-CoA dioxygenase family protein [Rhodospirillales bacterium]